MGKAAKAGKRAFAAKGDRARSEQRIDRGGHVRHSVPVMRNQPPKPEVQFRVAATVVDVVLAGLESQWMAQTALSESSGSSDTPYVVSREIAAKIAIDAMDDALRHFAIECDAKHEPINDQLSFSDIFDGMILRRIPHVRRDGSVLLRALEDDAKDFLRSGGQFSGAWGKLAFEGGRIMFTVKRPGIGNILPPIKNWTPAI